jgi:hypothetical protein
MLESPDADFEAVDKGKVRIWSNVPPGAFLPDFEGGEP